jgi:glycosyltransferase involved in cell wall biosynthesis
MTPPTDDHLRVMLFEQPARTSNKYEIWAGMPDAHVTVVSDRDGWGSDDVVICKVLRAPLVGGVEGWTAAPALLRGLSKVDASSYDVIASHELYSFTTAQAARVARKQGVPHVVHISETMTNNIVYKLPPYSMIARRSVRSVSWFVCTTERARQHAIELGCDPDRCTVVHSGIDVTRFSPAPDGLTAEPELLFVGMLRANRGADKGIIELMAAVDKVHAAGVPVHLTVIGDGHLRPHLEEMASTRPYVDVIGRVPRDEIPARMRASRVLALPSKKTWKWEEQFGFVLAEAMASGLAVIATTSGSIPEVVAPWNSLVPEGDVDALAEGLTRALGPEGDDWGRRNRAWSVEHFEIGQQSARLRAALARAAGRV